MHCISVPVCDLHLVTQVIGPPLFCLLDAACLLSNFKWCRVGGLVGLEKRVQTLATVDLQIEDTHSAAGAKEVTLAAQTALQHIFEDCQQVGTTALP
jgi:hypothetical protein